MFLIEYYCAVCTILIDVKMASEFFTFALFVQGNNVLKKIFNKQGKRKAIDLMQQF